MSDSSGWIHDSAGIDREKLAWIMDLKNNRRGRISEYADHFEVSRSPSLNLIHPSMVCGLYRLMLHCPALLKMS